MCHSFKVMRTEQHRIVAKVDELMALCDELEAGLNIATTTRRQLLEATFHDALEGGVRKGSGVKALFLTLAEN